MDVDLQPPRQEAPGTQTLPEISMATDGLAPSSDDHETLLSRTLGGAIHVTMMTSRSVLFRLRQDHWVARSSPSPSPVAAEFRGHGYTSSPDRTWAARALISGAATGRGVVRDDWWSGPCHSKCWEKPDSRVNHQDSSEPYHAKAR